MIQENKMFNFNLKPNLRNVGKINANRKVDAKITVITIYDCNLQNIMQTAESLFKQTFPYFEWLVITNESINENDAKTLLKLKDNDTRIKILDFKNFQEMSTSNFYESNVTSNILFFLKSGSMLDNTFLECSYFTLLTNNNVIWAYSDSVCFGDENHLSNSLLIEKENKESKENEEKNLKDINPEIVIRKDKFLEIEGYNDLFNGNKLIKLLLEKKYNFVKMNFYGIWNRIKISDIDEEINDLIEKSENLIIKYPIENKNSMESPYVLDFKEKLNKEKKNILFLVPWLVFGGADNFNLDLVKALKERGYKITIVLTEPHEYVLRNIFEEYVDEIFDLTTFLNEESWPAFLQYLIFTRNIDIVFQSNSMYGYHVIPWLKTQFPSIPFVDFLHAEQWEWRNGGYPRDSVAISNFLDMTYVSNKNLENILFNEMNRKNKNVKVKYLGIDIDKFDPSKTFEEEENLKAKYDGRHVILFPCRLAYIKRPLLMLEVLKKLKEKDEKILCLVVGEGAAFDDMHKFVENNNLEHYVEFLGYHKDIRKYYKISDVTLICSLSEGISLTTYESLAMGVPVVTSDVGGQKELVDQTVGRVIKNYQSRSKDEYNFNYLEEEINEYVAVLQELLNSNNKDEIKNNCREKIVKHFSSIDMLNALIDEFDMLVSNNNSNSSNNNQYLENIEFIERFLVNFTEKEQLQRNLKNVYELLEKNNIQYEEKIIKLSNNFEQEKLELQEKITDREEQLARIRNSRSYKIYKKVSNVLKYSKK